MDLQSARKAAQKQSKEQSKLLYINLDEKMECEISEKADKKNENVLAAFNKGIEVPISDEPKTTKTNAALAALSSKSQRTTASKSKKSEVETEVETKTEKPEVMKKGKEKAAAKAPAKKVAAKKEVPAKKSAAKKEVAAEKKEKRAVRRPEGKNKTLTVAEIIKLQKKGTKLYRQQEPHYILIPERIAKYANKEKEMEVIVAE